MLLLCMWPLWEGVYQWVFLSWSWGYSSAMEDTQINNCLQNCASEQCQPTREFLNLPVWSVRSEQRQAEGLLEFSKGLQKAWITQFSQSFCCQMNRRTLQDKQLLSAFRGCLPSEMEGVLRYRIIWLFILSRETAIFWLL